MSEVSVSSGSLSGSFASAPFACSSFDSLSAAGVPLRLGVAWTGTVNGVARPFVGTRLAFASEELEATPTGVGLSLAGADSTAEKSFGYNGSSLDFFSNSTASQLDGVCHNGVGLSQLTFAGYLDIGFFGVSFLDVHKTLPDGIANGPDGALWYSDADHRAIVRLDMSGASTHYVLPSALSQRGQLPRPAAIVAGPDGALWFTVPPYPFIGRITTAGVMSFYTSPNMSAASKITSGPDGAVWFTMSGSIGRITTGGAISVYGDAGGVGDITTGPDGALWFTDATTGVGRITTDGVISHFDTGSLAPQYIAAGSDGALWFTSSSTPTNVIGRVTTDGLVSSYSVPNAIRPSNITLGPDGAMWFSDQGNPGSIDRITTSGDAVGYQTAFLQSEAIITTGPDGALWFTGAIDKPGQFLLGRVDPSQPGLPIG